MKKIFNFHFLLISVLILAACNQSKKDDSNAATTTNDSINGEHKMADTSNKILPQDTTKKMNPIDTSININSKKKNTTGITFKITPKNTDDTNPSSIIELVNNGKMTMIATITGKAKITSPSEYATMGIPANAISACGAWWAGSGDYFYVISTKKGIEVYKGYEEEQQSNTGYHWKKMTGITIL